MEFLARLTDNVSAPAQAGASGVRALRTELQGATGDLQAFAAAGGRLGPAAAGGLTASASSAQAAAGAADQAGKALAGASSQAAAAGGTIKATWAAGQAEARAASGAFTASGKAASSAGKAAADVGGKAAAAGKAGSSAMSAIGGGASQAGAALGSLRGALPLLLGALGVAGAGAAAKLALGYRGVSQIQGISARAELNVRRLFSGVDASPVIRAYGRFMQIVDRSTVTGKALGETITRTFNAAGAAVEKLEPYVTAFAQGMLLAFLYAENGVLRARVALAPYEQALGGVVSQSSLLKAAAVGGGIAIAVGAAYAVAAAAPFLALAAAIGAVVAAFEQASKLSKEWDENSGGQIWRKIKKDLGLGSQRDRERAQGIVQGADFDEQQQRDYEKRNAAAAATPPAAAAKAGASATEAAAKGADPAKAAAAGNTTGAAMAAGMVAGMNAGAAGVQKAGEALAAAADKGVRDKAEIHSPSKLFRRTAAYMPEGQIEGFKDRAGDVQRAADTSLVPRPPAGAGASAGASGVVVQHMVVQAPNVFDEGGLAAFVRSVTHGQVIDALESIGAPST